MDSSSREEVLPEMRGGEVLLGDGSACGQTDLRSFHPLKLRYGVLVPVPDVKARFSFRTVTFGFRLRVGMANRSEDLPVLTAVHNPITQFHPSASMYIATTSLADHLRGTKFSSRGV
ncbi:hypothetical protein Bca4012_027103 [Brassica carinata]